MVSVIGPVQSHYREAVDEPVPNIDCQEKALSTTVNLSK